MSPTEEYWQRTRPNVNERIKAMFNNDLLSDVTFIIRRPESDGSKAREMEIPAHKFVLSISSPVFLDMFHGESAEESDVIELRDCEYENFQEMLRYIYSDEVLLTGSNVMEVLHLARQYKLVSLSDKCTEYLGKNLTASNVTKILMKAQTYEEDSVVFGCLEIIDKRTREVIKSDEFLTIDRLTLETITERDSLTVSEVELFEAVNVWSENQCEKQGLMPNGGLKRIILGERIVKSIRFPAMKDEEFANSVLDCNILSAEECSDIMKYFSSVVPSPLGFSKEKRIGWQRNQIGRFGSVIDYGSWIYRTGRQDAIIFSVDQAIVLYGICFCGNKNDKYSLKLKITDLKSSSVIATMMRCFCSKKLPYKSSHYWGFEAFFDLPVIIEKDIRYSIEAAITGSFSWRGSDGENLIQCSGVSFNFENSIQSNNGTNVTKGQFPELIFRIK